MKKIQILIIISLGSYFSLNGQYYNFHKYPSIDSLIDNNLYQEAKIKIQHEQSKTIESVNQFELLEHHITVLSKMNQIDKLIELKTKYVENEELNSRLDTIHIDEILHTQYLKSDIGRIYKNKSFYSANLMNHYLEKRNYIKCQKYFNLHFKTYNVNARCGMGEESENIKQALVQGEIYLNQNEYQECIKSILPLKFSTSIEYVYSNRYDYTNLDSMLIIAITSQYSKREIKNQHKQVIKEFKNQSNYDNLYQNGISLFGCQIQIRKILNLHDNGNRTEINNLELNNYITNMQTLSHYKLTIGKNKTGLNKR